MITFAFFKHGFIPKVTRVLLLHPFYFGAHLQNVAQTDLVFITPATVPADEKQSITLSINYLKNKHFIFLLTLEVYLAKLVNPFLTIASVLTSNLSCQLKTVSKYLHKTTFWILLPGIKFVEGLV